MLLRDELKIFLNNNGYKVENLKTFDNTIEDILKINPDLLLLDINLPNCDGEYICKEIRKKSQMPIIIITSRDNELDELISINYGADHYITKPFNIQILLAKITSILKRIQNISRDEIMKYLWDDESFIDDNTLTVNITRLRNKLEEVGLKELLETKRGQGYILKREG